MRLTQLLLLFLLWTGCKGQVVHGSMPDPRWMAEVRYAKGWLTIQVPAECKKTWYDIVVTTPVPGSKPASDPDPQFATTSRDYPQDTIYSGRMRPGESITKYVWVRAEYLISAKRDPFEVWGGTIHFHVPSHYPGKDLTHVAQVFCGHWGTDWNAKEKAERGRR